jgi:hypothetical protein
MVGRVGIPVKEISILGQVHPLFAYRHALKKFPGGSEGGFGSEKATEIWNGHMDIDASLKE